MKSVKMIMITILFSICSLLGGCSKGSGKNQNPNNIKLDPESPTTVSVWHYYNGAQQEAFNRLVEQFNSTVGKEKGIIVEGFSQGNVSDLESSVLASVNKQVGAKKLPSIFAAYADTAYAVDNLGYAVDLAPYLTDEEKSSFVDSYIQEGCFSDDGSIKIFPVAKSTEIFLLNKTDWDQFASATGTSMDEFSTIEGLTKVAEKYYMWTDSLTKTPEDGKAFFGRDAMANYLLIGSKQLGVEIFSVKDGIGQLNFDQKTIKKLWDHYYIPYINGYFSASGRFRSDDVKTGNVIAYVGSSSSASYFPDEVILSDTESHPIEMQAFECPQFANSQPFAVQQGAGMVVTKTNEKEIYASVEFLKWFTAPENNISFSVSSGYLPVKKEANNTERIQQIADSSSKTMSVISTSIDTVKNNTLYTPKAFANGTKSRNILEYAMSDTAVADRAVIVNKIAEGMTREQATADYTTDEYFEAWYQKVLDELKNIVK